MLQFFKMQLFMASLAGDLRKAVAQHDQTTITLDDMYQVATDTQRESRAKTSKPVLTIQDDSQSEAEDDEEVEDEVPHSKTGETTGSRIEIRISTKDQDHAANTIPEMETIGTAMESTASIARSKTTLRRNAGRGLKTINCAKTNKDEPMGLKCM
jgi:hypothetical protein